MFFFGLRQQSSFVGSDAARIIPRLKCLSQTEGNIPSSGLETDLEKGVRNYDGGSSRKPRV